MDFVLDRIESEARPSKLAEIEWPASLAPATVAPPFDPSPPTADVLVITYTSAEGQALADVLTPGHPSSAWTKYTEGWASYEPELTGRSPARESKCLGLWAVTKIGDKTVVLFKSDLHLSTDAVSLPVRRLIEQLVQTVNPELVITTGTAGGIGAGTQLGDVAVTNGARFNCQKAFKSAVFAQETFIGPSWSPGPMLSVQSERLMRANSGRLKPIASRAPRVTTAIGKPGVETVDYFGFADTDDSYGIVRDDRDALTEEMDDACIPLALQNMARASMPWLSIRNASDPQVPSSIGDLAAQNKWAAGIYSKFGYWTTVCSAIAVWAVVADLPA